MPPVLLPVVVVPVVLMAWHRGVLHGWQPNTSSVPKIVGQTATLKSTH
jgi:hypothetical protein